MFTNLGIMKTFLFILLYAISALNISGQSQIRKINLEEVQRFGREDDPGAVLGLISSFTIDKKQNIFILDKSFSVLKMFNKTGDYVKSFGMGKGKGPGEFQAPNSVSIDSEGNVYVSDLTARSISIFDKSAQFIRSIKVPFMPAQVVAVDIMLVDATGFPLSYQGDVVHRYNLAAGNDDKPILTYCERPSDKASGLFAMSGNMGKLRRAPNGDIYYSLSYPYEIRRFSAQGDLLDTFTSERTLTPPKKESSGMVSSSDRAQSFVVLPDNIILVVFSEGNQVKPVRYFDFFNGISGELLGTFSCKELGLDRIRYIQSDPEGNLYLDISEPFPQVVKYNLIIE